MSLSEKRIAYQQFFLRNEAGKQFMQTLQELIQTNHTSAETNPELARDHVQRAKGNRQVIEHIQSLVAERSKPAA